MPLSFAAIFGRLRHWRSYTSFKRAHERRPCSVMGSLYFVDRGFAIPGRIDEISLGGVRFHPALSRLLDRTGDLVRVRFGSYEIDAKLMNTSDIGYGLRFARTLTPAEMEDICTLPEVPSLAA